jgi:transposase
MTCILPQTGNDAASNPCRFKALIAGDRDPGVLAELAKRRLRSKIPALTEALTGRFTEHHAFLARVHLDLTTGIPRRSRC